MHVSNSSSLVSFIKDDLVFGSTFRTNNVLSRSLVSINTCQDDSSHHKPVSDLISSLQTSRDLHVQQINRLRTEIT